MRWPEVETLTGFAVKHGGTIVTRCVTCVCLTKRHIVRRKWTEKPSRGDADCQESGRCHPR